MTVVIFFEVWVFFVLTMTFWQENYAFIKDVYDSRSGKLIELMDKTDKAIGNVLADKIYTSNEFKKIKETFMVGGGEC